MGGRRLDNVNARDWREKHEINPEKRENCDDIEAK